MLDARLINHIKQAMPELQDLQILVGGRALNLGGYESVNALLIQNNVLDQAEKNIAIFHPATDLLDILILIIMGIAAYKDSIIKNSKLLLNDFKIGELIEYEGLIVKYEGICIDSENNLKKIRVSYGDKYKFFPTAREFPIEYFPQISKYLGSKIIPDVISSKKKKIDVRDSLRKLLGNQDQQIGLSGYPTFLIASERPHLTELLKEVIVNGIPFFDLFPSVKCTSDKRQRLGRDNNQRAFMFYFVSSLSTADDVLRTESSIRTLFVDARRKALDNGSLLASIRTQYRLEDIYWLQTYSRLESVEKLEAGLGFRIWIWNQKDFAELAQYQKLSMEENKSIENDFLIMANEHNKTLQRLSEYEDILVEIPYPNGMTLEQHELIQMNIRELFSMSNDYGNVEIKNISIHMAGIANRIFQSPLSANDSNAISVSMGKRTFEEDIKFIREQMLTTYSLPEEFKNKLGKLLLELEDVIKYFDSYYEKCNQIKKLIDQYSNKKISVYINPKYPYMQKALEEKIFASTVNVTNNITQAIAGCDIIIWTFKPQSRDVIMFEPGVKKNFILCYPLQKRELEQTATYNSRHFRRFTDATYRSEILKIPVSILRDEVVSLPQASIEIEAFDLEKLLSATMQKVLQSYQVSNRSDIVNATMVLFTDGTHALFQQGNKIKILNLDDQTIETETVSTLSEGDEIVFLKDSKHTVFEELVDFYEHKPEIIKLIKFLELWRTALIDYQKEYSLHPIKIKRALDNAGLVRGLPTIENWLAGAVICPDEDNYAPVDIIAQVTNNTLLKENLDNVKDAARKMHALRIKIGRYLAKKITQSYISPESIIDDPVLRDKLDEASSHVQIARVSMISDEPSRVPADMTNKILTQEDL